MKSDLPGYQDRERMLRYGIDPDTMKHVSHVSFKRGETLIWEGEEVFDLFILMSGRAKACHFAANGKDLAVTEYLSEGLAGDLELLLGVPAVSTVIAVTPAECIRIPFAKNREILLSNLEFVRKLAEISAGKLISNSRSYSSIALTDARTRLVKLLLNEERDGYFETNLTAAAAGLGISYRHLFRLLGQLCDERMIEKDGKGYRIPERKRLENTVGF